MSEARQQHEPTKAGAGVHSEQVAALPAPIQRRGLRTAAKLTSILLIAGAAWLAWRKVEYQFIPKRFVAVEPGFLYRSGQISPRLIRKVLQENEIDLVVSMLHYDENKPEHRAERAAVEELGIEQVNLHLRGNGTGDIRHYAEAVAAVARAKQEGKQVLVHCAAGARRSAGVVAAYQVLVEKVPPEVAYQELDRFGDRPVAESPLLAYLNENMETLAKLLVEMGVIRRVPEPLPQFRPSS